MKKILSIILAILIIAGCGNNTARFAVEKYLKRYKTLDSEVLLDMESIIEKENLNDKQKDKYREVLKKQYKDLSYEIISEEYGDEVNYVTVKITVYDLYQAQSDALINLENNPEEFNNALGEYDVNKYIDYKLDKMLKKNDRIDYTIVFTVTKDDKKYVVNQPTENDLKKIHGVYNYELN